MQIALDEAGVALDHNDVPVGAVIIDTASGEAIARAHNTRERDNDPTAHAEVLALRAAAHARHSWRLDDCALVVTIEPCLMCAGAAWLARIPLIAFGAPDPKAGASGSLYNFAADPRLNHETKVIPGVRADECAALISDFFAHRR
jgi:tRNA(adenine34) deaminase